MDVLKKNKSIAIVVAFFGILYSLISLVNHYCFRTYALDLGAYTNALYDYIRFQWNDSSVFKEAGENLLADHFDLYLILFSPFSLILGTYTLLIIQILFLLFGGVGVYAYFRAIQKTKFFALCASLYFYLFFGVFAAVSYDYHSNVIAASLIPWFFYLIKRKRILKSSILLLFILVSKENISLWLVFVCIGLAIEYRKDYFLRNYLILAAVFSGIYFISIISVVMPAFSNNGNYPHFHYSYLGSNYPKAFIYLISHPVESFKVLFINHNNSPHGDFVKLEIHLLLIFSGLLLLLKKPQYIFMLAPVYFQKLFHDNYTMWGIGGQYSIEFAPVMAVGIFSVISEFKKEKLIKATSVIVLVFTIASTFRTMDNTVFFTDKSNIRFYQERHYKKDYNIRRVHKQLLTIPSNAVVSVQSPFLPHLSLREKVYQFPVIKDAEYVIYSEKENTYPLSKNDFNLIVNDLKKSEEWEMAYDGDIKILKRRNI